MPHFPEQKPYEKVEMFLRRHWLVLFFVYFRFSILVLIGFLAYYFLGGVNTLSGPFSNFILVFYLLILWQFLFKALTDLYLDTWIVTDHRILDIHQIGLFKRDISELRLSRIQDVSVKIEGMMPTFFNFGDVIIQTAGVVQEFKFQQIPNPQWVKDKILGLHDQYMRAHPQGEEKHELS